MTARVALNMLFVGGGVAGGRVYCDGLLRGLATLPGDDLAYTVFVRRDVPLPDLPADRFTIHRAPVSDASAVRRTLWEYGVLPGRVRGGGFDVLHSLGSLSPTARPVPLILTLHDLTARRFPESQPLAHRWFMRAVGPHCARRAERVLVPSRFVAEEVVRLLDVKPDRVRVIPYGPGHALRRIDDPERVTAVLARHCIRRPYVLSVGRGYPHKNLAGLLRAIARLPAALADTRVVLVGEPYMVGSKLTHLAAELGLTERLTFTGFVNDSELAAIYTGAAAFAFPSLAEGFGLPVLEAMACGTPVVSSKACSLPEVVGAAGELADASDPDAFAAALAAVLVDPSRTAMLRAAGERNLDRFSWERCAAETANVYREFR